MRFGSGVLARVLAKARAQQAAATFMDKGRRDKACKKIRFQKLMQVKVLDSVYAEGQFVQDPAAGWVVINLRVKFCHSRLVSFLSADAGK